MRVGVTLWFGWGGVVSVCRLKPAYGYGYTAQWIIDIKVKFTLEQATTVSTLSLTLALYGGEWSTPCPGHFTPGKDLVPIL